MALLAIDSTGKTTGKEYVTHVCMECGWQTPIYLPGASLVEIIKKVVMCPDPHGTLCIVSNANKVVDMDWKCYESATRDETWLAITTLASHIKDKPVSKHLILFGADVNLWVGAKFPSDYRRIQQDILNMLLHAGLNCGTGMETNYGDFGRFQNKLDKNWHIMGIHRDEAVHYLAEVLHATSLSSTSSLSSFMAHGGVTTVSSLHDRHSDVIVASSKVDGLLSSHSSADIAAGLGNDPSLSNCSVMNTDKSEWIRLGREGGYPWPRCSDVGAVEYALRNVLSCPVDDKEGTVLICTSGDQRTKAQAYLTCQMLNYLGWRPNIVEGIAEEAHPPKSWNIGCKASFAWYVSIMPQILACARRLGDSKECLMVVEDSCWPSYSLTPQRVHREVQTRGKALWLAASCPPKEYMHIVGDRTVSAFAASGCKCFCGDNLFWENVDRLFTTLDATTTTNAIFQMMVGLDALDIVHPFLGCTMPHFNLRTGVVGPDEMTASDIAGTLLPLPKGWLNDVNAPMNL